MGRTKCKEKTPEKHETSFVCMTCQSEDMDGEAIKQHLREVHAIEKAAGTKRLVLALDGAGWYSNTFEFDLQFGIVIRKFSRGTKHSYGA